MMSELNLPTDNDIRRTDRIMGGSMVFVATRCTLQYVILPFVLPLVGLSGAVSAVLSIAIDMVALGMIGHNVKRLWPTTWRWRYLGLSTIMIFIIGLFLYLDIRFLLGV
jgi:hypothetical protein